MALMLRSGKCPQCALDGKEVSLLQNSSNFWECSECYLQLLIEQEKAVIIRLRGENRFQYRLKTLSKDYVLEETGEDSYRNEVEIADVEHLKSYLLNQVGRVEAFSIQNLIDTYVEYTFQHGSMESYQQQSAHFGVDFDDNSIDDKLYQRDQERKHAPLYAHSRLYRFLKLLLEKYHRNDSSLLPEMGMSKIEHYLCLKHFPSNERKIIDSHPLFTKQSLVELIEDIIDIVYFDTPIILSYDFEEHEALNKERFE